MTDEQRPWRAWPEYNAVFGSYEPLSAELDPLCARVWREAQAAYKAARVCEVADDIERAEAQRDRLAAALEPFAAQKVATDGDGTYRVCTDAEVYIARAALADVPDALARRAGGGVMATNYDVMTTTNEQDAMREAAYAEGYRAGRIAALREVGCGYVRMYGWDAGSCKREERDAMCEACRLLAEAESGEDAGEVGDDR